MVYYLKVNRNEGYMIRNLKHWLDVVRLDENASFFIICDNPDVKKRILSNIEGINETDFVESDRTDSRIAEVTLNNTSDFWNNASYSHLTTFKHAKSIGTESFWNIDADDTCFCMPADRVLEILKKAEKYAEKNNIHAFSFDMSRSRRKGTFWSFGVTYTDNKVDWFEEMLKHCYEKDLWKKWHSELRLAECVDTYFTYLNECSDLNMGTFYVENCKFVHYSNDFVYRPWCSWFATYKDGKIIKPMLKDFYGLESVGVVEIWNDVVKIDIGLTDDEQVEWLINQAAENDNNKRILHEASLETRQVI